MGAVRHRELIRLLSLVVALDMAVGVVALAVRSEDRHQRAGTTQFAGSVGIPLDTENGGILAGGNFTKRRGSNRPSTTRTTGAPTTSAPGVVTTNGPSTTNPPPTTGSPAATTQSTTAPTTTATNRPAPGSTSTSTGRPPVTRAAPPATTATSGPAAAGRQGHEATLTDPAGDTFVDGTQDRIKEGRADIVRARAAYEPGKITFVMQVAQPVDPRTDERWAGEATFASWSVDTNGDGTPEFDIQYFFDEGQLGGSVSRPEGDEPEIVCEVSAVGYGPDGYLVSVPSSCLGNPASFSFRVTMYYDTNPKDENADVASDVTPNGGLSFPVSRPN